MIASTSPGGSARASRAAHAVSILDPEATVRAVLFYPLSNGRNLDEIKRLVVALEHSNNYKIATPANRKLGEDVIVPPPGCCGSSKERVQKAGQDYTCLD